MTQTGYGKGPAGPLLSSLPEGYRAVVVGASGGIGSAIHEALLTDNKLGEAICISRASDGLDITNEQMVAEAASKLGGQPIHVLICATGVLTIAGTGPEKSLRQISPNVMLEHFSVNAIGPALIAKHFLPLLDRKGRSLSAFLSARVGSIGDNRLGGWVSYRASKAALKQIVRTAAIEVSRTHPESVIVATHPGTVETKLSAPYVSGHQTTQPATAARNILAVLNRLQPGDTGSFVAYDGSAIEW